jgi:L-fuculose-phosphate aldolase
MDEIAEQVSYVGRMMFERRLTDMAGGNVSARCGDKIYISPRYSGSKHHWQLQAADIVTGDIFSDEVLNHPMFSREGKAHLAIYRNFPDVTGIVHGHPFHVLPFCAAGKSIEPVLEDTMKFGVIECVKEAPAHSADLAQNVLDGLRGKEDRIRAQAAAILLPKHGIIAAGKTLLAAIDAVERIDWNAYCLLAMKMID